MRVLRIRWRTYSTAKQGNLPGPVGGGSGPAGPLAWIRTRGSDRIFFSRILSWIRTRGSSGGSDPQLDPGPWVRGRSDPQLDPGPWVHWRVGSWVGPGPGPASAMPALPRCLGSASRFCLSAYTHWPSLAEAPGAWAPAWAKKEIDGD
jgi:hypothetical protein